MLWFLNLFSDGAVNPVFNTRSPSHYRNVPERAVLPSLSDKQELGSVWWSLVLRPWVAQAFHGLFCFQGLPFWRMWVLKVIKTRREILRMRMFRQTSFSWQTQCHFCCVELLLEIVLKLPAEKVLVLPRYCWLWEQERKSLTISKNF